MSPTRPPTFHEKYLGGRTRTDADYNRARAHRPEEQALHTRRWQAVREMVMQRDGYTCQPCLREGRIAVRATDADHIIPRKVAPERTYDLTNIEAICRACHNAKTRSER